MAEQLAAVGAEISKVEDAIKRYQLAFEAGTMSDGDCGPRIHELRDQLPALRSSEAELEVAAIDQAVPEVTDELLEAVCARIERVIDTGSPAEQKALVRDLVHEIVIDGKRAHPTYRVPGPGVRIMGPLVDPGPQNTNPAATLRVGPIDLAEAGCRTGRRRASVQGSR